MKIIGISGKINTGKSTLAKLLHNNLPGWYKIGFADLLKTEVAQMFGFNSDLCYSDEGKKTLIDLSSFNHQAPHRVMSVRTLLQWWGTDIRRKQNPDCWVKTMADKIRCLSTPVHGVIIDDIRFPNEADFVRAQGGLLVRLEPYPEWDSVSDHESETALDNYTRWDVVRAPEYGELQEVANEILGVL